jgi:hypothetical protein
MMKGNKFNWGTGILIAIIIFMSITVITVIYLMNQKVDLVTDNYYAKELKYQEQIDKMSRTNAVGDEIKIITDNGFVHLMFPKNESQNKIVGSIHFYRPSDSNKDFIIPLSIDTSFQQVIPTQNLDKGYWKIKLDWNQDSVGYYKETSIIIN